MKSCYLNIHSFILIHWKVYWLLKPGKIAFNIKIIVQQTMKFIHKTKNDRFRMGKENMPQLTGGKY